MSIKKGAFLTMGIVSMMAAATFGASTESDIKTYGSSASENKSECGWKHSDGAWYYYNALGHPVKNTWLMDGSGRYYLGEDGSMAGPGWCGIDGGVYCFSEQGAVLSGKLTGEHGVEYFAGTGGILCSDEWVQDQYGTWYYINADGSLRKNDFTPDGYYMGSDGTILFSPSKQEMISFSYGGRTLELNLKSATFIRNYLLKNGWNEMAICGVLGNFQQESLLTADLVEFGGKGYGLGQWTGDRRERLHAYAAQNNKDVKAIDTQLDYLLFEPKENDFVKQYATRNFSSAAEAAAIWARSWERYPEDGSLFRVRIPYAEAFYHFFTTTALSMEENSTEIARLKEQYPYNPVRESESKDEEIEVSEESLPSESMEEEPESETEESTEFSEELGPGANEAALKESQEQQEYIFAEKS